MNNINHDVFTVDIVLSTIVIPLSDGFSRQDNDWVIVPQPRSETIADALGLSDGECLSRTDPRLIEAVRRLDPHGEELAVVTIPGDVQWEIECHEGYESIREVSRLWKPFSACGLATYYRFGPYGPVYEIVEKVSDLPNGDTLLRIRVLESGEELNYELSKVRQEDQPETTPFPCGETFGIRDGEVISHSCSFVEQKFVAANDH